MPSTGRPRKSQYGNCGIRDPNFRARDQRVLDLYTRTFPGVPLGPDKYVISGDEKTSVQARCRCHPTLAPGQPRGRVSAEKSIHAGKRKNRAVLPRRDGVARGRRSIVPLAGHLTVTHTFAALRLLPMSDREKDMEILALRHQLAVLEQQLRRAL